MIRVQSLRSAARHCLEHPQYGPGVPERAELAGVGGWVQRSGRASLPLRVCTSEECEERCYV